MKVIISCSHTTYSSYIMWQSMQIRSSTVTKKVSLVHRGGKSTQILCLKGNSGIYTLGPCVYIQLGP